MLPRRYRQPRRPPYADASPAVTPHARRRANDGQRHDYYRRFIGGRFAYILRTAVTSSRMRDTIIVPCLMIDRDDMRRSYATTRGSNVHVKMPIFIIFKASHARTHILLR